MCDQHEKDMASVEAVKRKDNRDLLDWRCLRSTPVSGLYSGRDTARGRTQLDLRVDIDPLSSTAPVTDRVSGDLFDVRDFTIPGGLPVKTIRTYKRSFIIDKPAVELGRCSARITGTARMYNDGSTVAATIDITWGGTLGPGTSAVVSFTSHGMTATFQCTRKGSYFREMTMEIDVCQSTNVEPILPIYDTFAHDNRPADLPQRNLTIQSAYADAGVRVTMATNRDIVDDSGSSFTTWNVDELHGAMADHFNNYSGTWPKWQMWGFLASKYVESGVGGIMFDAAAEYGGAGSAPERQGFAVFRRHSWFNDLVATPTTQAQAEALRKFLYCYVHEAGHAFNLLHSWDKDRADALSWMNYDWKYDALPFNGDGSFWSAFHMQFDAEELVHIRHGNRAAVIMGADAWASGNHLEAPMGAMAQTEGPVPLELLVRSKGYFSFMEPVHVELRLRNLMTEMPAFIDTRLAPEYGIVAIVVRRPDGRVSTYSPIACKIGDPEMLRLAPAGDRSGADRFSKEVFVGYGSRGFAFTEPGEYHVRAIYRGADGVLICSNVHRLRVGVPGSRDEDRMAQDYFDPKVGMYLALGGSRSDHLAAGKRVVEAVLERFRDSEVAARLAVTVADSLSRPFHAIRERRVVRAQEPDFEAALDVSKIALRAYSDSDSKSHNLPLGKIASQRAGCLAALGRIGEAQSETTAAKSILEKRGVHAPVLAALDTSVRSGG